MALNLMPPNGVLMKFDVHGINRANAARIEFCLKEQEIKYVKGYFSDGRKVYSGVSLELVQDQFLKTYLWLGLEYMNTIPISADRPKPRGAMH